MRHLRNVCPRQECIAFYLGPEVKVAEFWESCQEGEHRLPFSVLFVEVTCILLEDELCGITVWDEDAEPLEVFGPRVAVAKDGELHVPT